MVDLQNRVFLDDAEKQQQPETGKNIDRLPGNQQRQDAEWHCQRQRQQDRNGMDERFELSGQHDVHKNESERERQHEVVAGAGKFLRSARAAGTIARVHMEIVGCLVQ